MGIYIIYIYTYIYTYTGIQPKASPKRLQYWDPCFTISTSHAEGECADQELSRRAPELGQVHPAREQQPHWWPVATMIFFEFDDEGGWDTQSLGPKPYTLNPETLNPIYRVELC